MFRLKLHKWLYSLAVIATLVSFSGYANTTPFVVSNTEWIQKEAKKAQAFTYYVEYRNREQTTTFSYLFYEFQFSTVLLKTEKENRLLFIEQEFIFNHFKTTHFNSLLKPFHLTKTVSSSMF